MDNSIQFGGRVMIGERQVDRFIRANRDPSALPMDRFESSGGKVRCVLCHADGWGTIAAPQDLVGFDGRRHPWWSRMGRWQLAHLGDHPWPCSCGMSFRQYAGLWRHIGAERPPGWGRQGEHVPALVCEVAS